VLRTPMSQRVGEASGSVLRHKKNSTGDVALVAAVVYRGIDFLSVLLIPYPFPHAP